MDNRHLECLEKQLTSMSSTRHDQAILCGTREDAKENGGDACYNEHTFQAHALRQRIMVAVALSNHPQPHPQTIALPSTHMTQCRFFVI